MGRVDGERLLIPALGLVHVAPQLSYLAPHVQDIMGRGEEVGGFLRARRGLGGLRHADVDLGCREKRGWRGLLAGICEHPSF